MTGPFYREGAPSSLLKFVVEWRRAQRGVMDGEGSPVKVARARNVEQISDQAALERAVEEMMAAHLRVVERYGSGEKKIR